LIQSSSLDITLFGGEAHFRTPCEGEMVVVEGGADFLLFKSVIFQSYSFVL
jgi:hypothetical protein